MLLSMTGFGEARGQAGGIAVVAEVRTINGRHLKLNARTSDGYGVFEPQIDSMVRERIRRGTVQLNLRVTRVSSADDYRIDADVLEGYRSQLKAISSQEPPIESLLTLPGVVVEQSMQLSDHESEWAAIQPFLLDAIDAVDEMRRVEGEALAKDLRDNCQVIAEQLTGIEGRAPLVTTEYGSRLTERVNRALGELNLTVEPAELLREIALFADRSDISEEVVRLKSHIEQFVNAIELPESNGRKLEFIAQEMGRETNTIGSKSNDTEIAHRVVEIKTALERIREQVQNVE